MLFHATHALCTSASSAFGPFIVIGMCMKELCPIWIAWVCCISEHIFFVHYRLVSIWELENATISSTVAVITTLATFANI